MAIAAQTLMADLAALDQIGRTDAGLYRIAWTPAFREGRDWLKRRFAAAGLRVVEDAAANVWGWWDVGSGPALVMGSHIDSVPDGGTYDGPLGVLGALAAIESLRATDAAPPFPLAVVAWADEEGARFGTGFFGSGAFVGQPVLDRYFALAGESARGVFTEAGVVLDHLRTVATARAQVGAYLELHIEQGPRLEAAGVPLGIVSGIFGILRHEWTITGAPRHAGTTPYAARRDAGIGAARAMIAAREVAQAVAPRDGEAVATVGTLALAPNAANIVPGRATFLVDMRALDADVLARMSDTLAARITAICTDEGLTATMQTVLSTPPTPMHPAMREAIAAAAARLGVAPMTLPSGAGHDAGILAPFLPAAMIFVPSRDGISHAPDEYTTPAHLALGANALLETARVLMAQGLPTSV